MGLEPLNGYAIAEELTAAEDIAAYLITKYNSTDKTKVNLAGTGDAPLGVAIPNPDEFAPDGNGGFIKRTGWKSGEKPTLYDSGTVYVKLGAQVTAGQKCVPMAGGLGAALAADSFSTSPTNTEVAAAFAARNTVLGEYRKSGAIGDIVPVKIEK